MKRKCINTNPYKSLSNSPPPHLYVRWCHSNIQGCWNEIISTEAYTENIIINKNGIVSKYCSLPFNVVILAQIIIGHLQCYRPSHISIVARFQTSPLLPGFRHLHCCPLSDISTVARFQTSPLLPGFRHLHCCPVSDISTVARFQTSPLLPGFRPSPLLPGFRPSPLFPGFRPSPLLPGFRPYLLLPEMSSVRYTIL
jgi:hypothetical protein